jgi:hypothetical protein
MNEFFKILNYLSYDKVPFSELTEAEIKSINPYMLHRYLSMVPEYCILVNEVQAAPNLTPELLYIIYLELLPKAKKYFKYTKAATEKIDKDKVSKLSLLMQVSQREANDYLALLSNDQFQDILNSYGQNTDTRPAKGNKKQSGKRNKLPK